MLSLGGSLLYCYSSYCTSSPGGNVVGGLLLAANVMDSFCCALRLVNACHGVDSCGLF